MRVISQDGKFDIPYELINIEVVGKTEIVAQGSCFGSSSNDNFTTIAEYTAPKKAEKAMKLMHKAYSKFEVMKAIMPGCADRFIKGYSINPDNDVIKELDSFNTFRFPGNSEIDLIESED